jgi:hypothetical protein
VSKKRIRGLRPLAGRLPKLTAPAFAKRGLLEAGVITDWPHIVGAELSRTTAPVKLTFARGERSGGVLHVRVASGAALEIQHRAPQIVARINGYFGYGAVARIAIAAGVVTPPAERQRREPAPLSATEEAELRRRVADIDDSAIRDALLRLGRSVAGNAGPNTDSPISATKQSNAGDRTNDEEDA